MKTAEINRVADAITRLPMPWINLERNLWLVLIPTKVKTITMINEQGFSPHERREDVLCARALILGFGDHAQPEGIWHSVGAKYWVVNEATDAVEAFKEYEIDLALDAE